MNILYTSWILNLNRITRIIIWAFFGCSSTEPISGWHLVAPQLEQTKEKNHWKETHLWAFRSGPMADTLSEFFFFFFLFVAPHSMWHCLAFLLMGCFAVFYDFSHPSTAKQWTGLNWTFPCHSNSYISFVLLLILLFFCPCSCRSLKAISSSVCHVSLSLYTRFRAGQSRTGRGQTRIISVMTNDINGTHLPVAPPTFYPLVQYWCAAVNRVSLRYGLLLTFVIIN